MWFNELMDNLKQALQISRNNFTVYVPAIVKSVLYAFLIAATGIGLLAFVFSQGINMRLSMSDKQTMLGLLVPLLFIGTIALSIIGLLRIVFGVGSINIYNKAINNEKPSLKFFFEGVRKYFLKALGLDIVLSLFAIILFPIALIVIALYFFTVGLLTAGWGIIFLYLLVSIFFGTWMIILVVDNANPLNALIDSLKIGYRYFWPLFIIYLGNFMISKYLVSAFGFLITIAIGWIIHIIVNEYFKLAVVILYRNHKEQQLVTKY